MFKVGDLVTGNEINGYGCTNSQSLCLVTRISGERNMEVRVVCHVSQGRYEGLVEQRFFEHCTYDEFKTRYPEAKLTSSESEEYLRTIVNSNSSGATNEPRIAKIAKEKFGEYELTEDERESLRKEITELLQEYDYDPTEEGVDAILDEWIKNKGWMINLFKKHPKYNGKYQIVFDTDYDRVVNKKAITRFACWINDNRREVLKEYKITPFSYREVGEILNRLSSILNNMTRLGSYGHNTVLLDGKDYMYYYTEQERFRSIRKRYEGKYCIGECCEYEGNYYTRESRNMIDNINRFASVIVDWRDHLADESFAKRVNSLFPSIKAVAGQKVSRIVGKVCKLTGLDKLEDYNKEFAKYCDAINPLTIKRFTILSCHPVDYLTMSFGNSWSSCHTIDKNNKRDMANGYQGQYSSGTLSYGLDESSFVFYTVDKGYTGNKLELEPKINRNMFHIGQDKLIQARIYPQVSDGETGLYKQIREIAQKVIADCLEVPNMWKNVKGKEECSARVTSKGTHYKDYVNFSDCNVSYLKSEDDYINFNKIIIGHEPICPKCGEWHNWAGSVECPACYNNETSCTCCGSVYSRDADIMHCIDGQWYCEDCCFYCQYHERWEPKDIGRVYINDHYYGSYVCEEALDSGEFVQCEQCEEWYCNTRNGVTAEDGTFFCDRICARHGGYSRTSLGNWYPSDEVLECTVCGSLVHVDEWNSENDCCSTCAMNTEESEAV